MLLAAGGKAEFSDPRKSMDFSALGLSEALSQKPKGMHRVLRSGDG
jgi:hypothetical protein